MDKIQIIDTDTSFDDINLKEFTPTKSAFEKDVLKLNPSISFSSIAIAGAFLAVPNTLVSAPTNIIQIEQPSQDYYEQFLSYQESVSNPLVYYIEEIQKSVFCEKTSKLDIIKNILSFKSLNNNWDGYSSIPLEVESASNVISLIDKIGEKTFCTISDYYPNPNGTISLIWENDINEVVSAEIGNNTMSYFVDLTSQNVQFYNNVKINNAEGKKMAEFINVL